MDSHQVQQGPGVRHGIQILKHTEPFYRSQLLLRLGFLTEGDPECWPTWTCWLRWGWGHSVKVVRSTSREGVSSGFMVSWWEEHRRVAPQRPPAPPPLHQLPFWGLLSDFSEALFLDLIFKSETMLLLQEQNTPMPFGIKTAIQRANTTSGIMGVNWPHSSPRREQACQGSVPVPNSTSR